MKLKINTASDLSSISVLPHPARRTNGSDSSVFGKSQGSQLRSQASQQSFSQSQHGMFSQISQNSLDEILNEQRIGSEEKENSIKKMPALPMTGYSREESQMALSRNSNNQLTKWNSTSSADHRSKFAGQKNEELENRIWSMENSLNRFAIILDSVQKDIMQANKGSKEVLMEMESIRQKLSANDNLLQRMNKGQEDVKSNLIGGFKSISDQVNQDVFQEKLREIYSSISALKGQMDVHLQVLKSELGKAVTEQMQAVVCSLKIPQQKHLTPIVVSPKATACSLKIPKQKHLTPIIVSPKAFVCSLKMPEQKHSTPILVSTQEISRRPSPKQMPPLKKQNSVDGSGLRENRNPTTRQNSVNGSGFRENQNRVTTRQNSVNDSGFRENQNCLTSRQNSVNDSGFRENQNRVTTRYQLRSEVCGRSNMVPKVEVGSWTSVKSEQATVTYNRRNNVPSQKRQSPIELDKDWRIPIETDEEINGGFSCLFEEKVTGNYLTADVKEETDRIMRRARRRKRKSRNIIVLN